MDEPAVDLSDEALAEAFPNRDTFDVLVTVNADWIAQPRGLRDPIAYMVSGATGADIEMFEANANLALEWAMEHGDAWEVIVPQHGPPTVIELGDDDEDES